MRNAAKVFWLTVFVTMILSASVVFGAAASARTLNLPDGGMSAVQDDDDTPEVTARVARISFIRGDVQIRRIGNEDWEKAVLNLPLVEGDEVTTSMGTRLELQFNNFIHLRLDADAFLKISVLKDTGVAVSLSQGTMNLRITDFDKAGGFFEIDAPKTTIAAQNAGTYRIDAGQPGDAELRVSTGDGGEARVYSDNAGFTLKSGRGARVFIDGNNAGEWETADAATFTDEFDTWALDRDAAIAKRLQTAYYDKYYDQDIYGADDLDGYGEWIHTSSYGYVWRPFGSSISSYSDWSPYRYGHWRWVPPFGWTWVNDEPWGWATYHHGRWVYDNGYWAWAPYGYYRQAHSWWAPALVVISIISDNICWYPLGYHHHYHDYNHDHGGGWGGGNGGGHGGGPSPSPTPGGGRQKPVGSWTRQPGTPRPPIGIAPTRPKVRTSAETPGDQIPPTGVITISAGDFGTTAKGTRIAPVEVARSVLVKGADDTSIPILPPGKIGRDVIAIKPRSDDALIPTKTGAVPRKDSKPLDQELRNTRIYGGRSVVNTTSGDEKTGGQSIKDNGGEKRKTGAVERVPSTKLGDGQSTGTPGPGYVPAIRTGTVERATQKPKQESPAVELTPKVESPRYMQPREQPRSDPPPPKNDTPREKPRSDPPPTKSEPKTVDKPAKVKDSR